MLYGYKDLFALLINPSQTETVPLEGLEGIRVAIASEEEEEIYSCVTNKKGVFRFPKLRPGRWNIKVFTERIPLLHQLNMNDLMIDVLPGESVKIDFSVTPTTPQVFKLESEKQI